jgi:hypothetical protein
VDSETSYMYCPLDGSAGNATGEQFALFSSSLSSGSLLQLGSPMMLKSLKTGKWVPEIIIVTSAQLSAGVMHGVTITVNAVPEACFF